MNLESEIQNELKSRGADLAHFVDISHLHKKHNKNFPVAILVGMILSRKYLGEITLNPDYVAEKIRTKIVKNDEFEIKEKQTDTIADFMANFLTNKGYKAYSQSEKNIADTGFYDFNNNRTPLPHKTVALLAGLGWIGKHNLLVTRDFGSAISMCTVLTDAPLKTKAFPLPTSSCGNCKVCVDVCADGALHGNNWKPGLEREKIIDVNQCTTCIKCLVFCPWTQKYISTKSEPVA